MEPLALSLPAVLVMGLAFGAGPCNVTCLPFLGPVLLTNEGGMRRSWRTVMPFFLGRLVGYTLLAAVAGAAGKVLSEALIGEPGRAALGGATMIVGVLVVWRSRRAKADCTKPSVPRGKPPAGQSGLPLGLFGMGMGMALNPCMPLGTVLVAAAATAEAASGAALGFAFGVGAVLIPLVLFGTLIAYLGAEIRSHLLRWKTVLEGGAGALLILLGTVTAIGWVQP